MDFIFLFALTEPVTRFFYTFDQAREAIVLFRCFYNGCLIPICTKHCKELVAVYFEYLPTKLVKILFIFSISAQFLLFIVFNPTLDFIFLFALTEPVTFIYLFGYFN